MNAQAVLRALKRVSLVVLVLIGVAAAALVALLYWYFVPREQPERSALELAVPRGMRVVTLYFAAPDGDSLVAESRSILETERVTETVSALVAELARGPEREDAAAVLPARAGVRHVFLDEAGEVYIDFSPELVRGFRGGSAGEYLLLGSLVRTLAANLPTVSAVTLTVEGRPIASLGGHFALEGPLRVSEWR